MRVRVAALDVGRQTGGAWPGREFYGSGIITVDATEAEVSQALQQCLAELSAGKSGGAASRPALSEPDGGRRGD